MSSPFSTITVESARGVLAVTLSRPEAYNAFNEQMSVELATAFKNAQRDDAVRCVLLTGAGKAFCAGQDLKEIEGCYKDGGQALDFGAHLRRRFNPLVSRIRTLEKPVIAAVNGVAAGAGASFAFACDLRIAARTAYFTMAFAGIGLVPDSAATLTLLQHAGYSKAIELCWLGEKLGAEEAARFGLVNRVVEPEQLADASRDLAERLASLPTRALGLTKRAFNKAWTETLEGQLEYEAFLQQTAGQTSDHGEGVRAFLEKRRPKFSGT